MADRFVVGETTRLDLSGGDWIRVKKRLNYGDQKRLGVGQIRRLIREDGQQELVVSDRYEMDRILAWVTEWSLDDDLNLENLQRLDPVFGREIEQALDKHISAVLGNANGSPANGIQPTSDEPR